VGSSRKYPPGFAKKRLQFIENGRNMPPLPDRKGGFFWQGLGTSDRNFKMW
jgi:hypothetical protein